MVVSLDQAKRHLRVLHDDDDADIEFHLHAASARVLRYCNRTAVPSGAEFEFDAAALLFLGDLYENREAQADSALVENKAARALIDPYRLLRV